MGLIMRNGIEYGAGASTDIVASQYSTSASYAMGDYCVYENAFYRCTATSTSGTWDSTAWTKVDVGSELESAVSVAGTWLGSYTIPSGTTSYTITSDYILEDSVVDIYFADDSKQTAIDCGESDSMAAGTITIAFETATTAAITIDNVRVCAGGTGSGSSSSNLTFIYGGSDEYDSTVSYSAGDYCIYGNVLYCANTTTTIGDFTASEWDRVDLTTLNDNFTQSFEISGTKTTTFNSDGSITETATSSGQYKTTVFNSDGSITESVYNSSDVLMRTKVTVFNSDGSITETVTIA